MFENIRNDLRAHGGNWGSQGFWVLVVYRFGRWRYLVRPAVVRKFLSLVYRVLFKLVQILTGIELPCEAEVGDNFTIDHFGGIIVSGFAKLGNNCRIRDGVVIGLRRGDDKRAPPPGGNVDIWSGGKPLGADPPRNNSFIGGNA